MQLLTLSADGPGPVGVVRALAFAAGGAELVALTGPRLGPCRLWRIDAASLTADRGPPQVLGAGDPEAWVGATTTRPRLSPGGRLVTLGGRVWGLRGEIPMRLSGAGSDGRRYPRPGCVPLAFSADGRTLAGWEGRRLLTWPMDPDECEGWLLADDWEAELPAGHAPEAAAFSPDGATLALLCSAGEASRVLRWDAGSGQRLPTVVLPPLGTSDPGHLLYSPDGRRLVAAGAAVVTDSGRRLGDFPVEALAFAPDGRQLLAAASDGDAVLWDVRPGGRVVRYDWKPLAGPLHSVAVAPDGLTAFAGGTDGRVVRFDL